MGAILMATGSYLTNVGNSGLMGGNRSRPADDFLWELTGREGYARYNEMRLNSPIVAAMLRAIEYGVLVADWSFSSSDPNDPRVDFLTEAFEAVRPRWKQFIKEGLTCLPFGFAPFAIDYRRDSRGRILWEGFRLLGQDTIMAWEWDGDTLTGLRQYPHIWPDVIPIERIVNMRYDVERDNPEGRSMLRGAWVPYYYQKGLQTIEAISMERVGAGLPVIKLPLNANVDEHDPNSDVRRAEAIVSSVRVDEQAGVVLPAGWEFEFVSSPASMAHNIGEAIKRHESRILMTTLSQFLLLGQDRVGSQSLSSDQTSMWTMAINSITELIAEAFTAQAVRQLLILNGYDPDGVKLDHSPAGEADAAGIATLVNTMGNRLTWTADDEAWLRNVAGMPDLADSVANQRGRGADVTPDQFAAAPVTRDALEARLKQVVAAVLARPHRRVLEQIENDPALAGNNHAHQ